MNKIFKHPFTRAARPSESGNEIPWINVSAGDVICVQVSWKVALSIFGKQLPLTPGGGQPGLEPTLTTPRE